MTRRRRRRRRRRRGRGRGGCANRIINSIRNSNTNNL